VRRKIRGNQWSGGQSGTLGIIRRLYLRIWGGQEPPPPPEEKIFCPRGRAETQPMLPARSALTPGPQQRLLYHFFKSLNCYKKGNSYTIKFTLPVRAMGGQEKTSFYNFAGMTFSNFWHIDFSWVLGHNVFMMQNFYL